MSPCMAPGAGRVTLEPIVPIPVAWRDPPPTASRAADASSRHQLAATSENMRSSQDLAVLPAPYL
jgi:hypothetical protein